jgi:hypothetical protein
MLATTSVKIRKPRVPRSGQNLGVTTYVSAEDKAELEEWAKDEERSLSWLVGKILQDALAARRKQKEAESKASS